MVLSGICMDRDCGTNQIDCFNAHALFYRSALNTAVWSDFPLHGKFMVMYLRDIYDHNFSR